MARTASTYQVDSSKAAAQWHNDHTRTIDLDLVRNEALSSEILTLNIPGIFLGFLTCHFSDRVICQFTMFPRARFRSRASFKKIADQIEVFAKLLINVSTIAQIASYIQMCFSVMCECESLSQDPL